MAGNLVALDLSFDGKRLHGRVYEALDGVLSAFVRVATDAYDEASEGRGIAQEMSRCRDALATATVPRDAEPVFDALLRLCERHAALARPPQKGSREDIARLVTLLRDAIGAIIGEENTFSSETGDIAARLNALLCISDIHELKQRLAAEVTTIKDLATSREARWKVVFQTFEARVAKLELQLEASERQALADPVTGAGNRRAFDTALVQLLESPWRAMTLALVDVDNFKSINDTFGHATGDEILQTIADTLRTSVREQDVVARIGGDEFAVVMTNVRLAPAETRLRIIVSELAKLGPPSVTVSCGLVELSAGDTAQSLFKRADKAVYEAKRQGKNRVVAREMPFIRDLLKR